MSLPTHVKCQYCSAEREFGKRCGAYNDELQRLPKVWAARTSAALRVRKRAP